MRTEVHNHYYGADPRLDCVVAKLDALIAATESVRMAIDAQTQALLDRFDAATTTIGEAIGGIADDLRRLAAGAGLSPEARAEFEARFAELEAQGDALKDMDAEHVPDA